MTLARNNEKTLGQVAHRVYWEFYPGPTYAELPIKDQELWEEIGHAVMDAVLGKSRLTTFSVPLPSGAVAGISVPFQMQEEDFRQLSNVLARMKDGLVHEPAS